MKQMSVDQVKRFVHNQFPIESKSVLHFIGQDFLAIDELATMTKQENFVVPFLFDAN